MATPYVLPYLDWFNDETGTTAEAVKSKDYKKRVEWFVEESLNHRGQDAVPILVKSLKYLFEKRIEAKDDFRSKLYECAISRINWNEIAGRLIEQYLERK